MRSWPKKSNCTRNCANPQCAPSSLRTVALGTSICLAIFLLLGFDSVLTWSALVPWIVVVLVFHTALGLFYRTRLLAALPAIHLVGSEIGVLREGLRLLQYQKFNSPLLTRMAESCRPIGAPSAVGKTTMPVSSPGVTEESNALSIARLAGVTV